MKMKAPLCVQSILRAGGVAVALSITLAATAAWALPEPKRTVAYSLEVRDGGGYFQQISGTPLELGDVDFVMDTADSLDPDVTVTVDTPLTVTIEYTADAPGGNIVDGPVELVDVHFERQFSVDAGGLTLVQTTISTMLERIGTGTLSGSTITWSNSPLPYQEDVIGEATCTGVGCGFVSDPFPRDLDGIMDVPLPNFTVMNSGAFFGDSFASDNGTPGDPSDDINRPDVDATVKDTWVPEPSGGVLLATGVLGLAAIGRHGRRGPAPARSSSAG